MEYTRVSPSRFQTTVEMKNPKIKFIERYTRKYLEYIDEMSITKYTDHVRNYFEDGGIRHAVPIFSKEL